MLGFVSQDQAILGFLISVLFLTGLFMYAFFYLIKREKEIRTREQELQKHSADTIERSHRKARDILAQAVDDAKNILSDTKLFKQTLEADVQTTIDKEMTTYRSMLDEKLKKTVSVYDEILSEVAIFYKNSIKDAAERLKSSQEKQEKDYKSMIEDESLSAKFYIQRRINEELDKANREIQDYKQSELGQVRKQFETLIDEISESIFEGSLTPQQHENLIFKALEEAKKNKIFTL